MAISDKRDELHCYYHLGFVIIIVSINFFILLLRELVLYDDSKVRRDWERLQGLSFYKLSWLFVTGTSTFITAGILDGTFGFWFSLNTYQLLEFWMCWVFLEFKVPLQMFIAMEVDVGFRGLHWKYRNTQYISEKFSYFKNCQSDKCQIIFVCLPTWYVCLFLWKQNDGTPFKRHPDSVRFRFLNWLPLTN